MKNKNTRLHKQHANLTRLGRLFERPPDLRVLFAGLALLMQPAGFLLLRCLGVEMPQRQPFNACHAESEV